MDGGVWIKATWQINAWVYDEIRSTASGADNVSFIRHKNSFALVWKWEAVLQQSHILEYQNDVASFTPTSNTFGVRYQWVGYHGIRMNIQRGDVGSVKPFDRSCGSLTRMLTHKSIPKTSFYEVSTTFYIPSKHERRSHQLKKSTTNTLINIFSN